MNFPGVVSADKLVPREKSEASSPLLTRSSARRAENVFLGLVASVLVLFLGAPLLGLVLRFPDLLAHRGRDFTSVWTALRLSLQASGASLALSVLFGTPLAYLLARSRSRLAHLVSFLVELPILTPPAVAGVLLLLSFGAQGFLPKFLGIPGLAFTFDAVVIAGTFVSGPFFVKSATAAFRNLDREQLDVARTLGAGPFRIFVRLAIPSARSGLIAGATMCFARALGEFGATLLFAGNLEGKTQTLPLSIYGALESDLDHALLIASILTALGFGLLLAMRASLGDRRGAE